MKILADENIDQQTVERLRARGHHVLYVCEMAPGISDEKVLEIANSESCVLLTSDKDFGDLVFRQGRSSTGIALIRLTGMGLEERAAIVAQAIDMYGDEMATGFSVIARRSIRIRRFGRGS